MKIFKVFGIGLGIVLLVGAVLAATGYGETLFFKAFMAYHKPAGDFDADSAAPAPDYGLAANWAALPDKEDPSDLVPDGVYVLPQGEHPVDVFFIHPTGFLTSKTWNSSMSLTSGTEENTQWMMANQASAYNGCCNIYAPRYREATILAYFGAPETRDAVLGFAYQDVKRAFEYYLANKNDGKPFIIAGHSQGSHHAKRLLREVIDVSDLHQRMIAAYMIGSIVIPLSPSWFDSMQHISPCESADDLHCVVAWDTMPEGSPALEREEDSLCTNPVSWKVNEEIAEAEDHQGAVVPTGAFNTNFGKAEDAPSGEVFDSLAAPIPKKTWAQCRDGSLFVSGEQGPGFEPDNMGTFHVVDYALFYMNIHNNAKLRASRFLAEAALP